MFVEKTKTFSLIEFKKSMLKLKKNPNDVDVRNKVEKKIELIVESFNNLMDKCFGEEDVADVSSMFGENNNEDEKNKSTEGNITAKENNNEDEKNKTIEEKRMAYFENKNNMDEKYW